MTGLFDKTAKQTEIRETINKLFGPYDAQPLTLEEQIEQLSDADFKMILSTAAMVKRATHMQNRVGSKPVSYYRQMKAMYPRMKPLHQQLVGDMLEAADPLSIPDTSSDERDAIQQKVLDDYDTALKRKTDK